MSNIKSGGIGIDITPSQDAAPCRFPKINRARLASFMEGEGGRTLAPATIIWAQGNGGSAVSDLAVLSVVRS